MHTPKTMCRIMNNAIPVDSKGDDWSRFQKQLFKVSK